MTTEQGIAEIVNANNQFALNLFAIVKDERENVFFSPYSISEALVMTMDGARGKTAQEMDKVLRFPTDGIMRRSAFLALDELLRPQTAAYALNIANALWVDKEYKLLDEFINIVKKYFRGEVQGVDFLHAAEEARIIINNWVSERTNGKIKEPIQPRILSKDTRLVLANAIYFKGDWLKEFDKKDTKDKPFNMDKKRTVTVRMMANTGDKAVFNYFEHKKFQLVELVYKGEELSMLVLLPTDRDTKWLEKHLKLKDLNEWKAAMKQTQVDVFLPQFKLNCGYTLNNELEKMGMKKLFDRDDADLSGIDGKRELSISALIHQAYLDVNEIGTEAAAVTIMAFLGAGVPQQPVFYADHPFLFFIQHRRTGDILFMGKLMDPTA